MPLCTRQWGYRSLIAACPPMPPVFIYLFIYLFMQHILNTPSLAMFHMIP